MPSGHATPRCLMPVAANGAVGAMLLVFSFSIAEAQQSGGSNTPESQAAVFAGLDENQQQRLLDEARRQLATEQAETARLELLFESQGAQIDAARAALNERLGWQSEFYGVLQTVVADTRHRFDASLTRVQFPDRTAFLADLEETIANPDTLAPIDDIDQFVYQLQREIVESGKIVRFKTVVSKANGQPSKETVVRVGLFNLVSDAGYLYMTEDGLAAELERQPFDHYADSARDLASATEGVVTFALDPTRGGILGLLMHPAEFRGRRLAVPGTGGYGSVAAFTVVALGLLGLMILVMRLRTNKNR